MQLVEYMDIDQDKFFTLCRDNSTLDNRLDIEHDLINSIFPDGQLPTKPTGANGDKAYKEFGSIRSIYYDIWMDFTNEKRFLK